MAKPLYAAKLTQGLGGRNGREEAKRQGSKGGKKWPSENERSAKVKKQKSERERGIPRCAACARNDVADALKSWVEMDVADRLASQLSGKPPHSKAPTADGGRYKNQAVPTNVRSRRG